MSRDRGAGTVPASILAEAADWMVRIQSDPHDAAQLAELHAWCARSPAHARAWHQAQQVLGTFDSVPAALRRTALAGLAREQRRRATRKLALMLVGAPAACLAWRFAPWEAMTAGIRTAVGETREVRLADGTRVTLDTDSAIDVSYSDSTRLIKLRAGRILIDTEPDPAAVPRPFVVETPDGVLRALGTRFVVRRQSDASHVEVYQGAVEVRLRRDGAPLRVGSGQWLRFGAGETASGAALDGMGAAWAHGMLAARNLRLEALAEELARYRPGIVRCDPTIADLRVTGAFPLRDTDRSLDLLAETLGIRVRRRTRYWVMLEPGDAGASR
ncbi:FecR domain-containing protein [Cupriavidus cauae]|uniref:FecR domain-containing protein n=1 Tax=Cupriavidus cauae TaxID=2608999 RepID=UPI0022441955|nr:FecR domain-containing protein [Cupriavidus cauae]UZN51403.1 FecR domain-containing protein [Cupriavidus cauae]